MDNKETVERLRHEIEARSGHSTDNEEGMLAKEQFEQLELAKYLRHVVEEGDPEERMKVYECLTYISIRHSELLLLLPDDIFEWFANPCGKAKYESQSKLPRLVTAFHNAVYCSSAIKSWDTLGGQYKDISELFDSRDDAVSMDDKFVGLDNSTAKECLADISRELNNLPVETEEIQARREWVTSAEEWLNKNEDRSVCNTSEFMLAAGAGYVPDMLAEGLVARGSSNGDDGLSFVKDIPLASIHNCATSEELYDLLKKYKR